MRRLGDSRRLTAGGPSFDDRTRAGAEKFGPNQPPHRLHAPARSPPGHREVPEGGRTGGLHSAAEACGVPPHTVQYAKMQECVLFRIRTRVWSVKKTLLSVRPNYSQQISRAVQGFLIRVSTDRGSCSQGTVSTVSTQSTPHPRARITPAGKSPCEVARELRDPTPFLFRRSLLTRGSRRLLLIRPALASNGWPSQCRQCWVSPG